MMGANDAAEMLEAAQAECVRLERKISMQEDTDELNYHRHQATLAALAEAERKLAAVEALCVKHGHASPLIETAVFPFDIRRAMARASEVTT